VFEKKRIFHILKGDYQYWKYKPRVVVELFSRAALNRSFLDVFVSVFSSNGTKTIQIYSAVANTNRAPCISVEALLKGTPRPKASRRLRHQSTWRRPRPSTPRARTAFTCRNACGGLNDVTIVTKPSPHESNPDHWTRSMSLRARGWSLRRGGKDHPCYCSCMRHR